MAAPYKLTEEIARYHLEVIFKRAKEWEVCFSNPTAGPWKLIKIGGYIGGKKLRYIKEEDRPDLILFSKGQDLFLIIEAKDSLSKFILRGSATQAMEKSINVFEKEATRIDSIVAAARTQIWGPDHHAEYKLAVGYLFPVSYGSTETGNQLAELFLEHQRLVVGRDTRLQNCVVFEICQDSSYGLHTEAIVAKRHDQTTFVWVDCLPQEVQRTTHHIEGG